MKPDAKTLERIAKVAIMYNGQKVDFNNKYLELMDNVELEVVNNGDDITIKGKVVMKGGKLE